MVPTWLSSPMDPGITILFFFTGVSRQQRPSWDKCEHPTMPLSGHACSYCLHPPWGPAQSPHCERLRTTPGSTHIHLHVTPRLHHRLQKHPDHITSTVSAFFTPKISATTVFCLLQGTKGYPGLKGDEGEVGDPGEDVSGARGGEEYVKHANPAGSARWNSSAGQVGEVL